MYRFAHGVQAAPDKKENHSVHMSATLASIFSGLSRVLSFLTTKATNFCPPLDLADPGASCSTVARPARPMVRTPCSWRFTKWLARSMPQHVPGSASQPFWWRGLRVAGACAPWNARAERQSGHPPPARKAGTQDVKQARSRIHPHAARRLGITQRQGAKVHQLASEIPLRLPDVRSACAVTGRQ